MVLLPPARPLAPGEGPSCGTEAAPHAAGGRACRGTAAARSWEGRPDGRECLPRAAGPELLAGKARWGDGGSESRGAGGGAGAAGAPWRAAPRTAGRYRDPQPAAGGLRGVTGGAERWRPPRYPGYPG